MAKNMFSEKKKKSEVDPPKFFFRDIFYFFNCSKTPKTALNPVFEVERASFESAIANLKSMNNNLKSTIFLFKNCFFWGKI